MRFRGLAAGAVALAAAPIIAVVTGGGHHTPLAAGQGVAVGRITIDAGSTQPALVIVPSDPELQRLLGVSTAPLAAPAPPMAPDAADASLSTPTAVPPTATAPPRTPSPTHPPVPPPQFSGSQASMAALITDAANRHGVSAAWMIKIARCESNLNPRAYNPSGPYYGLFQFLLSTFRAHGGTNIWDPAQQADVAAWMLSHGGANAWACA